MGLIRTTRSGNHQSAIFPRKSWTSLDRSSECPCRGSTTKTGRSPHLASDRPITATRPTLGSWPTRASISVGLIHLATGLNEVLGAPGDGEVASLIDRGKVSRVKIALVVENVGLGFEVAFDHARTLHFEVADHPSL